MCISEEMVYCIKSLNYVFVYAFYTHHHFFSFNIYIIVIPMQLHYQILYQIIVMLLVVLSLFIFSF